MADEKKLRQAKVTFDTLCDMLDEREWKYDKDEDNFRIESGASGEDLPMPIRIDVDPERDLITLLSHMTFDIPEDKRVEMAIAVSAINYMLVDGSFDYDVINGTLVFRMTSSYKESLVGKELFAYMLYVSCNTVDNYNDKLMLLAKGKLTLKAFVESIGEE